MRWFWLWRLLGYEAVVAATHWSVRRGYFQVEDFLWVHLTGWRSLLASFYGTWGYATAYRPMTRVSYSLDLLAFGDWAPGWHFTNVGLHGANAALLALLLERLGLQRLVATAVGLLFLVAPLTAECVAFISDRTAILCLLFMLLSTLAWLSALRQPRRGLVAAMVGAALLGAMSYEAGFVLPAILVCLAPIAVQRTKASAVRGAVLIGATALALAVLLVVRARFLGMMTTDVEPQHANLLTAVAENGRAASQVFLASFGPFGLSCLALATIAALVQRTLRSATIVILATAVILYLPFLTLVGVGERFFYLAMAPFCILPVLATNRLKGKGLFFAAAGSICLFFPGFWMQTHAESIAISNAGQRTAVLKANILQDLPHDSVPSIIDNIPFNLAGRPLFGDFFELAISDGIKPKGPWVVRTDFAEKSPILIYDLLNRHTQFWVWEENTNHLTPITKADWLDRHPEVPTVLANIGPYGSDLGMTSQSADCALARSPVLPSATPADLSVSANINAVATTSSGDGMLSLLSNTGFGVMSLALLNKGTSPRNNLVIASGSNPALPLGLSICRTDPATALCLAPPGASVSTRLDVGATQTFTVFVKACGKIALDELHNRVQVEFIDENGNLLTSKSVAVRTIP